MLTQASTEEGRAGIGSAVLLLCDPWGAKHFPKRPFHSPLHPSSTQRSAMIPSTRWTRQLLLFSLAKPEDDRHASDANHYQSQGPS